jgi:signal-transduction protein with cAMP-binding, CBS, and nucleotidyltransferase domain
MTVMDIARTDVVTVDQETPVAEVARVMTDEGVGSVVVVDAANVPYGIVTDRDLAVYVCATEATPDETTARNVMATGVFTLDASMGVFEAMQAMADQPVRRAPIVDADGVLCGIVTLDDFLVLLAEEFGRLAEIVRAESPPPER